MPSSTVHRTADMCARARRAWTILAPNGISLIIRADFGAHKVSLTSNTNGDDVRFAWQVRIVKAMQSMKGFDENPAGKSTYEQMIVRADLRELMAVLCPLHWGVDGAPRKTSTARILLGWPLFDLRICRFEVEQLLTSFNNEPMPM